MKPGIEYEDECLEEAGVEKGQQFKTIYRYEFVKGAYKSGDNCMLITQPCGHSWTGSHAVKAFKEDIKKGFIKLI